MFTILTVVLVSQVYTYVKTYTIQFKYVQFILYQLYISLAIFQKILKRDNNQMQCVNSD